MNGIVLTRHSAFDVARSAVQAPIALGIVHTGLHTVNGIGMAVKPVFGIARTAIQTPIALKVLHASTHAMRSVTITGIKFVIRNQGKRKKGK